MKLSYDRRVAAVSDKGLSRPNNQDAYYISPDERVFVVADGMDTVTGGRSASELAVYEVEALWRRNPPPAAGREQIHQWLVEAISIANLAVFRAASIAGDRKSAGATILVAVQSDDGFMHIAHVGDCRAYLVRNGKTIVLKQNHSIAMEMLLRESLTPDQYQTSPFRHFLTRCVGHKNKVEIDETPLELSTKDWIVIATDGLSAVMHDEEIGELVLKCSEPAEVCDLLFEETLCKGAPDNVTMIAIQYVAAPAAIADRHARARSGSLFGARIPRLWSKKAV